MKTVKTFNGNSRFPTAAISVFSYVDYIGVTSTYKLLINYFELHIILTVIRVIKCNAFKTSSPFMSLI